MIRFALFLLLASLPASVFAQSVVVRSGEHGDFSRLAFEFLTPVEWKMGRVSDGYEIRLQGGGDVIDTSGIYRRISRNRIKRISVSSDNSRIALVLGCDCHADAFEFRPGLLVVDIKDGPPTEKSEFEDAFRSDEIANPPQEEVIPDVSLESDVQPGVGEVHGGKDVKDTAPGIPVLPPFSRRQSTARTDALATPKIPLVVMGGSQKSTERISGMQSEMLLQIGRAAAQGLLDANLPNSVSKPPVSETHEAESVEADSVKEDQHLLHPQVNIRVENSVDREIARLLPANPVTATGEVCLSDEALNIAEWGEPDSVWRNISKQRRSVSGEFDKADAHAVEALAKAYIYAGFGAEAKSAINEFNTKLENENLLKAMALIVDGYVPGTDSAFDGQTGCDSAVALWAVLAMPKLTAGLDINRPQVIGTFSGLPIHLRRSLGPKLAQRFLDVGDVDTARVLRNAIARAPGAPGPEFRLLDARLDRERGYDGSVEQALESIVSGNSEVAIEALIELLEAKLEQKSEVNTDLITSAESYVQEQRTTQSGANLLRILALTYAQSGDLSAALEKLREIGDGGRFDKVAEGQIWEHVLESAVNVATEEAFLRFVFSTRNDITHQAISRNVLRKIVGRVLDSGLSELAKEFLDAPVAPTADDRVLLARAAIIENDLQGAVGILNPVSGKEAARLKARAYELMDDYVNAAEEFASISDDNRHHEAVWRGGDWKYLQESGSDMEQAAAKIMTSPAFDEGKDVPVLDEVIALDKSLIEASESARHAIEILLEEYPSLDQKGS